MPAPIAAAAVRPAATSVPSATAAATVTATTAATATAAAEVSPASEFEACCRALNHKANKAIVEQLPLLQRGAVVDLSRNYVGAAGLQAIAVLLPHNPNVAEVRAPRNGITNDAVVLFCRAMRGHGRLTLLDLSDNTDVSLAGGLALLNMAQQTPSLRVVQLGGTHVPAAVLTKLARALDHNASHHSLHYVAAAKSVAAARTSPASTRAAPGAAAVFEAKAPPEAATTSAEGEAQTLQALHACVTAALADGYLLPPASPHTGWRMLDVPILAPPLLFDTEIRLLCGDVFPRLNEEFAAHRIVLRPIVVGGGAGAVKDDGAGVAAPLQRTAGSYTRALHFRPASDVTSVLERSRFAAIELVGDRPGDYAQLSAGAMLRLQGAQPPVPQRQGDNDEDENDGEAVAESGEEAPAVAAAAALQPVLYEAHETALRCTRWLLVATRRDTRTLHVPAALAPLLTADPSIAHPDRHRSLVRTIVIGDDQPSPSATAVRKAETARPGVTSTLLRTAATTTTTPAGAAAAAPAAFAVPTSLEWDYATEEYQWRRHVTWRSHVEATAPVAELVVSQYPAAFDCTDAQGGVRLKQLDGFRAAVYARLRTVMEACVAAEVRWRAEHAAETLDAGAKSLGRLLRGIATQRVWETTFLQAVAAASGGAAKKNLMNRMVLYAANPPSRNMLLLHGNDAASLASLMARGATRLQALQHAYTLAAYTTRSALLHEEPTDVRSVMTHVVSQLTTDVAVLRYVNAEVDVERLSAFFLQLLSGSVAGKKGGKQARTSAAATAAAAAMREAGLPDEVAQFTLGEGHDSTSNHAFVVVLDGLEGFTVPVHPCGALVHPPGSGGKSTGGGGAEPASWTDEPANLGVSLSAAPSIAAFNSKGQPRYQSTPMDVLLPRTLARQVRLIASCASNSAAFGAFRHLGRDSVEMLPFGAVSANEVEQYLSPASLARVGLVFSEDDFECARSKRDAPIAEYMTYLLDAARSVHEAPGFLTQTQAIQAFPDTLEEAAQAAYDRLVSSFGVPVTRHVVGLLTASRWGLLLPELRALLPHLSTCRLQELLRLLRPALEQEAPSAASETMGTSSGNVLLGAARLAAPSFIEVMQREALQAVSDELQVEDDQRVWHTQLAQYYLSIVYQWLRPGGAAAAAGDTAPPTPRRVNDVAAAEASGCPDTQALHRRAMKEVVYHMTQSGQYWPQMDVTVLSVPFLEQVYGFGLGYAYLRDLTAAFNERYQRHLLGEDIGEPSWQQRQQFATESSSSGDDAAGLMALAPYSTRASLAPGASDSERYALPAVLKRMRDYVCFAHQYGLLLSLRPTLVAQVALQIPASLLNAVQRDAVTSLYRQLQDNGGRAGSRAILSRIFFTSTVSAATGKQPTHLRPVTCAAFLPNRRFTVTASSDRSLAWVHPESGTVAWYARQPTAAVESLTVCSTSAYVAAVSEDRTVWVYDGLQGTLVSQCRGSEWFDAPIASVAFSERGRYLWVVTTDSRVRCFACESGQLRCTLSLADLLRRRHAAAEAEAEAEASEVEALADVAEWRHRRNFVHVLVDAEDDEVCTTVVGAELRQWRLHPWEEPLPTSDDAGLPAPKGSALVACELTLDCSLRGAVRGAQAPSGYTIMERWAGAEGPAPQLCVLAAPLASAEVQLLAVRQDSGTASVAVRCPLTASSTRSTAGSPTAVPEVSLMSASLDGHWLAVGLTNGAVNLFSIRAAFRAWHPQTDTPVVCRPMCVYTSLMPTPGMSAAPLRSLAFHRTGHLLFALGHCLVCWRLPATAATATLEAAMAETTTRSTCDGEYLLTHTPTCLTVLPPPTSCNSDAELPHNTAEVAVGDNTGRVTLLRLWQQLL
ncbi:Flagellar Member 5 [Novymonas esmeraldas]|uniref:Flagellar Member 5 n=1 Tax=Novymonas esmeraldas TaxID=1808958 RepID=A0AAW0ENG0_9TRYP